MDFLLRFDLAFDALVCCVLVPLVPPCTWSLEALFAIAMSLNSLINSSSSLVNCSVFSAISMEVLLLSQSCVQQELLP